MSEYQAAGSTDVGKVRDHNEDRYIIDRREGVLVVAVADGVGGTAGGELASEAAVLELANAFKHGRRDLGKGLAEALGKANDAVLGVQRQHALAGAATTVVAAAIRGQRLAIANLGDSRAYVLRGGTLRQVTKDHTGSQTRSITRFAGDPRGVRPDVFIEELRPGDRLLLCSDGVTIHLSSAELVPILARGGAKDAAMAIVHAAVDQGGRDNATAVVVVAGPRALRWELIVLWTTVVLALGAIATTLFLVSQQTPVR